MKGGEIGARVFDAETDREALREMAGDLAAGGSAPQAFAKREGAFLVLPRRLVFGTEELSVKAPAIAGLVPEARLFLSPADAGRLGLAEGAKAEIAFEQGSRGGVPGPRPAPLLIPVSVADLPEGVAALPWGLPSLRGSPLAAWAAVKAAR